MATINTGELFTRAEGLIAKKADLYKSIGAVRDALRNLRDAGVLSAEEKKQLAELFPVPQRKPKRAS